MDTELKEKPDAKADPVVVARRITKMLSPFTAAQAQAILQFVQSMLQQ